MTRPNDLILLVDDGKESTDAKVVCAGRQVDCKEVHVSSLSGPIRPDYKIPTLLVRGKAYQGLQQIKDAVNGNRHL